MRSNCPPSRKFTFLWPHSHTHSLQLFPPTLQLFLTVFKKQREREREKCAAAAAAPPPQVGGLVAGQSSAAFLIAGCVGGREREWKEGTSRRGGGEQPLPTCTRVMTRKEKLSPGICEQSPRRAVSVAGTQQHLGSQHQTQGRPPRLQAFRTRWEEQSGGERRGKGRGCSLQLWFGTWVVGGLRGGVTDCLRQQGRKT